MAMFGVDIGKIQPQRDEFKDVKGNVVEAADFWSSRTPADDVHGFKRFVVNCKLLWAQGEHPLKIVLNARSHFVRVIANGVPVNATMIAQGLFNRLSKYRKVHEFGKPPIVYENGTASEFGFAVDDAIWVCAVLHDLRERDGFQGDASIERKSFPFQNY